MDFFLAPGGVLEHLAAKRTTTKKWAWAKTKVYKKAPTCLIGGYLLHDVRRFVFFPL
jgi:hypothetical protein